MFIGSALMSTSSAKLTLVHVPLHTPHISLQFIDALKQLQLFLHATLQLQVMSFITSSGAGGLVE